MLGVSMLGVSMLGVSIAHTRPAIAVKAIMPASARR
jgi:hypothetical protein